MRPLLALTLLASAPLAQADSLRCGDRLVRTEALAAEVIAACGPPDYREQWVSGPGYGVDEEEWYYNFGAQRLVRVLRFRKGELVSIDADGYGFDPGAAASCAPSEIRRGASAFRLLYRCGEPASREAFEQPHASDEQEIAAPDTARLHERWVYDFGGDTRMRIVTLRDGRVADVKLGQYGSSPRDGR